MRSRPTSISDASDAEVCCVDWTDDSVTSIAHLHEALRSMRAGSPPTKPGRVGLLVTERDRIEGAATVRDPALAGADQLNEPAERVDLVMHVVGHRLARHRRLA